MDIVALARAGLNKAWALIASELKSCTLKCAPSSSYDAETDQTVVTWANEISLSAFIYGEKAAEKDATTADEINTPERGTVAMAIIRVTDCGSVVPNDQSELVQGSTVWKVQGAEFPPGSAIYILELRK
mgnify:CR=1 FL=1